jgi:hypothetical protein
VDRVTIFQQHFPEVRRGRRIPGDILPHPRILVAGQLAEDIFRGCWIPGDQCTHLVVGVIGEFPELFRGRPRIVGQEGICRVFKKRLHDDGGRVLGHVKNFQTLRAGCEFRGFACHPR